MVKDACLVSSPLLFCCHWNKIISTIIHSSITHSKFIGQERDPGWLRLLYVRTLGLPEKRPGSLSLQRQTIDLLPWMRYFPKRKSVGNLAGSVGWVFNSWYQGCEFELCDRCSLLKINKQNLIIKRKKRKSGEGEWIGQPLKTNVHKGTSTLDWAAHLLKCYRDKPNNIHCVLICHRK